MNPIDLPTLVIGIGGILALLGFAALLLQKYYAGPQVPPGRTKPASNPSSDTGPTVVEFLRVGRISTKYPALVFLFVGATMVLAALAEVHKPERVTWTVTAHVVTDLSLDTVIEGQLGLVPTQVHTTFDPRSRTITIRTEIEKGRQFEDVFEVIALTLLDYHGQVLPRDALDSYEKGLPPTRGESGLLRKTNHTRDYQLTLTRATGQLKDQP
jgi:hypothetical protein